MANNPWYYYIDDVLIKEKKPVLAGDFIHLHTLDGCYRVHEVNARRITIMKNGSFRKIKWNEFRCKKGMGNSIEKELKKSLSQLEVSLLLSLHTINKLKNQIKTYGAI